MNAKGCHFFALFLRMKKQVDLSIKLPVRPSLYLCPPIYLRVVNFLTHRTPRRGHLQRAQQGQIVFTKLWMYGSDIQHLFNPVIGQISNQIFDLYGYPANKDRSVIQPFFDSVSGWISNEIFNLYGYPAHKDRSVIQPFFFNPVSGWISNQIFSLYLQSGWILRSVKGFDWIS